MSEIVSVQVKPLDLPLKDPFEISLGTQNEASNILVVVETTDGIKGYGEGSPLPSVSGETQGSAIEILSSATEIVKGEFTENYREIINDLRSTFAHAPSAMFAVETAILDAFCRERNISLAELFGSTPSPIETDMTIGIMPLEEATSRAKRAIEGGFRHLKIKTGSNVDNDVDRVVAISEVTPNITLKVDANQGWTPKETIWFANQVKDQGVDLALIEQPVPKEDLSGLATTKKRIDVPIAADEAVFTPEDAIGIVRADAADVINVKLGKSGPLAILDIVAIARAADLELMVGCMLESAVGIHTSAHVVCGIGEFDYIDLDGNHLLAKDVISTSEEPVHDIAGPGHGVTPQID